MRLTLLIASLPIVSAFAAETPEAFFEKKVRPLLVEHCQECHGPEKQKGGLRLDSREGWQTGGDSGPALIPKDTEHSRLLKATSYTDRDLKMPPKEKLSDADLATLTTWIKSGAFDPRSVGHVATHKDSPASKAATHWAYQPIQQPKAPSVKDTSWPRNDIDRFILAKLESQDLKPAPDAPQDVLARRLAFDLTGLPASSIENPASSLQTNAFAERWAQHWLDAARFAESSGGGRTLPFKDAWRYRDYVIQSIRDDLPLDRFITEQIAGDLLPYDSPEQRARQLTATGFLVLGPTNYEEQDKAALRMDIVDEQLELIGKSILGMSLGCARCHDHKFDPIPTRDYYALAGILRSTKVIRDTKENVAHWIEAPLPIAGETEAKAKQHEEEVAKLEKDLAAAKAELKLLAPHRRAKDEARSLPVEDIAGIVVDDVDAKVVGQWKHSTTVPPYIGDGYLSDQNGDKGAKSITFVPKIEKAGRYEVQFAYTGLKGRSTKVPLHILHADGETDVTVDESLIPPIDDHFVSLGQYRFEANGQSYVSVSNEGTEGFVTADAVVLIPVDDSTKLASDDHEVSDQDPRLAAVQKQIKHLTADLKKAQKTLAARPVAMAVNDHEDLGDCPIHIRGNIHNLGEVAPRGFLKAATHGPVPSIPADQSGRIELAKWLTSPSNTLTARVLANRVWMYLFGEGLVRTADNFGVTGEAPSHPELLDHLANKLVEGGWSLKKLIIYIVDSRAYRMASVNQESGIKNLKSTDPDNHLLAHQNRKRLDVNALRDTILTISGKLDSRFLGPTIGTEAAVADANDMSVLNVEYSYTYTDTRRSVYTPAFRNKRLEMFEAFDFGNNNQPIAKRNDSAVSPQALFMMNHEFIINQSREAAKKLLADKSFKDDAARLDSLYHQSMGRAPTAGEHRVALDFVTISASEEDPKRRAEENWSLLIQTLFGSVDFRYVE